MIEALATIGVTLFEYLFKDDPANTVAITILFSLVGYLLYRNGVFRKKGHEKCSNFVDHLHLLDKAISKGFRIGEIKYRDTIFEQMSKVEIYAEEIKAILTKAFNTLLPKDMINERQIMAAITSFKGALSVAIDIECLGLMRKWIKENGFTKMDDPTFNSYIGQKQIALNTRMSDVFDVRYLQSVCIVPREELHEYNLRECVEPINKLLSQMFFEIRAIAEGKEKLIEEIKAE